MKYQYKAWFIILVLFAQLELANTSHYMSVASDNSLYYEESGQGQPIIFIPGWTATHVFFEKQISYFSKNYHAITFDPRSQGLSSATLDHNTYEQHGYDLANLINYLKLKNVILVGWSFGCRDAYSYVRAYGTANIKAFVCIDNSPQGLGSSDEWHSPGAAEGRKYTSLGIEHNRYIFTQDLIKSMIDRSLTSSESQLLTDQMLHTPSYAALLLLGDAGLTDYTKEAEILDKNKVPVLNVVSKPLAPLAEKWLKIHALHAELISTWNKHMMFWEHANEFNTSLESFLKKI